MNTLEETYWIIRIIAYLVIIPATIGVFRFNKIDRNFQPFFILIFFDFFTELLFEILSRVIHTNSISYNTYNLVSFFIIMSQFSRWNLLRVNTWSGRLLGFLVLIYWIADNFFLHSIWSFNSYSIIVIASLICFFSLRAINKVSFIMKSERFKNIVYITTTAWVIKYMLLIISEFSWIFFSGLSDGFHNFLVTLVAFFGGAINVVYSIVALWIPKKRKYSWLSP